ncbi:MAG: hypothetical protein ACXVFQ_23655 [Solirubrobacteraceae bacterium]
MGAILRIMMMLVVALSALPASADAASRKPAKHRCRPARSTRCLRQARGHEPVIVASTGRVARADALQAFVQTIAPLPGIRVQPGAVARGAFASASGPLRWAAAYLPTMTRAQRAAFRRALGTNGRSGTRHRGTRRGARARAAANPPAGAQAKWQQAANKAEKLLAQHLGVPLGLPLVVRLETAPDPDGPGSQAAAAPIDKHGNWATGVGPGVSCRIQVFPIAWKSADPDLPVTDLSHEVVHCFQFKLNSTSYATLAAFPWLLEGGAEWAGDQVAKEILGHDPHDPLLPSYWNDYLRYPGVGLFSRVYDAVGFFAHLAETEPAGAMWPTLREMFKSKGGSAGAYKVAVQDTSTEFLDSWASGYARQPSLGPGWDTTGIGITSTKPVIPFYGGTGNTQVSLDAAPRSSAIARMMIGDQVLQVSGSGGIPFGRLRTADGTTFGLSPGTYCVQGHDCSCPAGTAGFGGGGLPTIAPGVAWVALSANTTAVHITLARLSLQNFCKQKPTSPPVGNSHLTIAGGATGTSYAGGRNDSCTIHTQNPFPPGAELTCLFEIAEPGTSAIAQLSITTFHYTGPGYYHVVDRGSTVGHDIGFTDLSYTFDAAQMPPDAEAGGFTITSGQGGVISGGVGATMEDVTAPEMATNTASAGGPFTVPLRIVP